MRVEVVAEQQRRVVVGRREQARPAVVDEVALVDRLEPERVARLAERREDGRCGRPASGAGQSPQSVLSADRVAAIVSQTSVARKELTGGLHGAVDLLVASARVETNSASNCDGAK